MMMNSLPRNLNKELICLLEDLKVACKKYNIQKIYKISNNQKMKFKLVSVRKSYM